MTIWYWRKKFNIKSRSCGEAIHLAEANHCLLTSEAMSWINGELLGDACIYSYSSYSASFFYASSKEKYINYVSNMLRSFGIEQSGRINRHSYMIGNYGPYSSFYYGSLYYSELLPIQKKWYPQGKKIVPRDTILTPLTCRQWYIGDGGLDCTGKNPNITLYTCNFPIQDVEFLKEELLKLGFKVTRQPAGNVLHISTKSVKDFLNYIGPCPVECYQYKWKLRELK